MSNSLLESSDKIREQMLDICTDIKRCREIECFPPGQCDLETAEKLLADNTFDVVVCGEVKKGKSSLLNAIIGEDVLPVDMKVATSQAFRIINDDEQAYYLVYTDGARESVTREQLDDYGSQSCIDENGSQVETGRVIDYIEVHTPIAFLPKEAVLVDTPGIGALYANHANITFKHLERAMAAIFVMDPQNPLTEPETDFLKKVTDITPNVLLVMTKVDNYDESYIDSQIQRNTEILVEKGFGNLLSADNGQIRIFPVSSLLLSAVQSNEKEVGIELYDASSFEHIKDEFVRLISHTLLLRKNIEAYNILKNYNDYVAKTIANTDKIAKSPAYAEDLLKEKKETQDNFLNTWGEKGRERISLVQRIQSVLQSFALQAQALFSPGSSLYHKINGEIDALNSLDEVKKYASNFSGRMITEYGQSWAALNRQCIDSLNTLLAEYNKKMGEFDCGESVFTDMPLALCPVPGFKAMDHFNNCRNGFFSGMFITTVGTTLGLTAIAPLIPVVAVVVGGLTIFNTVTTNKAERYKVELRKLLNSNLNSLRESVMIKPMDDVGKSQLDIVKDQYGEYCKETINEIYTSHMEAFKAEMDNIAAKMAAAKQEQTKLLQQNIVVKNEWKNVYAKLIAVKDELTEISQAAINESEK